MPHPLQRMIHAVDDAIWRVEGAVLVALVTALAFVSFANVAMRNLFDANYAWIGTFYKFSMIYLSVLGAAAATRSARHITVDAASRTLSPRVRHVVRAMLMLICAAFTLAVAAKALPYLEMQFGDDDEAVFLGLSNYTLHAVIPVGFGLMGARFLMLTIDHAFRAVGLDTSPEVEEGPVA